MAAGRVSCNNDLFWVDTKLLESLRDNPTINLEAVAKWYWEWILRSESVIYREYDDIVFGHHVGPLSCVVLMLEATHANECASMEVQNHFLNSILQVLLSSRLVNYLFLVWTGTAKEAACITLFGLRVDHHFFGGELQLS